MRALLTFTAPAPLTVLLFASQALALGVCDPDGHFCLQLDATSARVCDVMQRGGLDSASCTAEDAELRDGMTRVGLPPMLALRLRFDEWQVYVTVVKHPAASELAQADLEGHAQQLRAAMEQASGPIEVFAPPVISRVHDVQVARYERQWVDGDDRLDEVDVEVFSRDALYMVSFQGIAGPHVAAFADSTIRTLDSLPARSSARSGEAVTWGVRGLIAAAVIAVGLRWMSRRRAS